MRVQDIEEGGVYKGNYEGDYFRVVRFIIDSDSRPGGKVVIWDTDGFSVRQHEARTHGKCGIETFARWACERLNINPDR